MPRNLAGTDRPIADTVSDLMPGLQSDLARLVAIPSISSPGYPEARQSILDAYELTVELLRDAGVQDLGALELPDTAPVITGEIPAPDGAPTVLLYSHYDVVPAGDEALWSSPPFVAEERDGAIFGRGTADSKSNVIAHVGALRAWEGKPPVGIKIVIEGQEEVGGGGLTTYPPAHPEAFRCDAMVIGDMGSVRPGVPTLTVALRGMAMVTIEVTTLAGAKHSGQFGGAAPDALIVVLQALATLHDANGDVAVEGLRREAWAGESYSEDEFRELAEVERACRCRAPGTSARASGRARRSPSPASTCRPSTARSMPCPRTRGRRSTCACTPSRTPRRPRPRSSVTSRRCDRSASRSRSMRRRRATASRRGPRGRRTRPRGRRCRRPGAASP
jgi:hypothetical protein